VQQEGGENKSEEPIKKRFKICEVAGSQIQQRENEIFPTALIKVPRNFASMFANAGASSSHDRLNYLGFSKQASTNSNGVTENYYEQDVMSVDFGNLITVEDVNQKKNAEADKDGSDTESDAD
jgi:hypothetical protein